MNDPMVGVLQRKLKDVVEKHPRAEWIQILDVHALIELYDGAAANAGENQLNDFAAMVIVWAQEKKAFEPGEEWMIEIIAESIVPVHA